MPAISGEDVDPEQVASVAKQNRRRIGEQHDRPGGPEFDRVATINGERLRNARVVHDEESAVCGEGLDPNFGTCNHLARPWRDIGRERSSGVRQRKRHDEKYQYA